MEKNKKYAVILSLAIAVFLISLISTGSQARDSFSITLTVREIHPDPNPPTISVRVDGRSVWANDYIKVRPNFDLVVKDDIAVDPGSVKVSLDGKGLGYITVSSSQKELDLQAGVPYNLEDESVRFHALKVEAADMAGNTTIKELTGLKVATGLVKL
ncbi:MAG: hypothetical protein KKF06_03765, partial [Candidatus Margulisbacteria bacterium]|nr:hypothetical protein [Candidatus Margulisiibacteriota bacterium]